MDRLKSTWRGVDSQLPGLVKYLDYVPSDVGHLNSPYPVIENGALECFEVY